MVEIPQDGIKMLYKQSDENTCAFYAMASALYIIGDEMFHEKVAMLYNREAGSNASRTIKFIIDFFTGQFRKKGKPKTKYTVRNAKNFKYDILSYILKPNDYIKLIRLNGLHAVCVWRNHIIESNYTHTLPLNEHWLRHVASIGLAVLGTTKLEDMVLYVFEFVPPKYIINKMTKF